MSHEPQSDDDTGVTRWYPADAVELMALAELLRNYAETTFMSSVGGCRVLIFFRDDATADACEEAMRTHWMLCIRNMVVPRQPAPGRHG